MNKYKVSLGLFICFGLAFVIWSMTEISQSFDEPLEALQDTKHDMEVVIPAYKINDEALYFFIDQNNQLGTAFLKEGIYGWKTGAISANPRQKMKADQKLIDYHVYDDSMIYGLLSDDEGALEVNVNGAPARTLEIGVMLEQDLAQKYNLEDKILWYYQEKKPVPEGGKTLKNSVIVLNKKGF
ncbi:hypothetical protein [Peribacillus frigoritolerans]|uniref:hypothetical protein n=1 Tax=Peribacillus frigoritolerans TaxID=450367 RepID=UPI0010596CEA|nr:hypothetical protein [Peribacillus frigoritolerans]TDL82451.1 hypothetical protein E2R53_02420 [Peribacillus frigoritolerans]